MLVDSDSFAETDAGLRSADPLGFDSGKAYTDAVEAASSAPA